MGIQFFQICRHCQKEVGQARRVMFDHLSVTCPPEVVAGGLRTFTGSDEESYVGFYLGMDRCRKDQGSMFRP